jgi:hypothetical protein
MFERSRAMGRKVSPLLFHLNYPMERKEKNLKVYDATRALNIFTTERTDEIVDIPFETI